MCSLKEFGDVNAFPMCIKSQDVDTIVETIYQISGSFGGVNLEDIAAPRCFAIAKKLKERCDIPIFHDDQHGTAVVTLAGLKNALKLIGKKMEDIEIAVNGAGAAAIAISSCFLSAGVKEIRPVRPYRDHLRGKRERNEPDQGRDGQDHQ